MWNPSTLTGGIALRVNQSLHSRDRHRSVAPTSDARRNTSSGHILNRKLFTAPVTSLDQVDPVPGESGEQPRHRVDLADVPLRGDQQPALQVAHQLIQPAGLVTTAQHQVLGGRGERLSVLGGGRPGLQGAKFQVKKGSTVLATGTTDTSGNWTSGYLGSNVKVGDKVSIVKTDAATGNGLAGATFAIHKTSATGATVGTITSVASGAATSAYLTGDVKVGDTVWIVETSAPAGFTKAATVTATVTRTGTGTGSVSVSDARVFGSAAVAKVDTVTGKPIPGVTFMAEAQKAGTTTWVTVTGGAINGTTTSPEGYITGASGRAQIDGTQSTPGLQDRQGDAAARRDLHRLQFTRADHREHRGATEPERFGRLLGGQHQLGHDRLGVGASSSTGRGASASPNTARSATIRAIRSDGRGAEPSCCCFSMQSTCAGSLSHPQS